MPCWSSRDCVRSSGGVLRSASSSWSKNSEESGRHTGASRIDEVPEQGHDALENLLFHFIKLIPFLPRWIASTSTFGLSHAYRRFCVASEGYRELFIRKGVDPAKIVVTGIPNFDNCAKYRENEFAFKNYVLVCTSDARDTFKFENRRKVIERAVKIADGRFLIFKLHPNEDAERARREIRRYAPGAVVFESGNTEEMIANCDVLITQFSSTVFVGIALGKEVYSNYNVEELKRLCPIQNDSAARNIAAVCRELLDGGSSSAITDPFSTGRPLRRYTSEASDLFLTK